MSTPNADSVVATHACGLCDGVLVFDGWSEGAVVNGTEVPGHFATFVCSECQWWHISTDCCDAQIESKRKVTR